MASSALSIFLLSIFVLSSFSNAKTIPKSQAFSFPISKDVTTNQYYTTIQIGSNSTTLNVVIDLGGNFLWFNSVDYFNAGASYRPIHCGTQQCQIANGVGCVFCYLAPPAPGCTNNTCSDYALNPITGMQGYAGLGQDVLHVSSTSGVQYRVKKFPFQFSDPALPQGLASSTVGMVALGRTRISLQAQLASTFKISAKFALCLSSSSTNGNLIIGEVGYKNPFQNISKSLQTTPLIRNPVSTSGNEQIGNFSIQYFINVRSINVGDTTLIFNKTLLSIDKKTGDGGTSIRTVRGYTSLHKSIYTPLINEFVKAAARKNIKRVASVAPFGACFDSKTIGSSSKTGPDVPTIDLVLQSKSVYWRFYGSNSMVGVSNEVICLAFVEGQPNLSGPRTSIVVGGYQMENHLLEFDGDSSRFGFSSSLLLHDTSCSQFGAA